MAKNLGHCNTDTDYFETLIDFTNDLLDFAGGETVSVNTAGATTIGNGFIQGFFGANVVVCSNIGGGSLTTPATLVVSTNVIFGNTA